VLALFVRPSAVVPVVPAVVATLVLGGIAVVSAGAVGLGWSRLGVIDRAALQSGRGLAVAARVAGRSLEPELLLGLLEERRWCARPHRRSRRLSGVHRVALIEADVRRASRTPGLVGFLAVMVVLAYAAQVLVPPQIVAALVMVGACAVANRAAVGLRTVARSAELRSTFPMPDAALRLCHLVAPALVAVVNTALAVPALLPIAPLGLVLIPVGATAVVWRFSTRTPPDFGGPLVDTGLFGQLPVDALRTSLRGVLLLGVLIAVQIWLTTMP
jgi:hypothetical protein